MEDAKSEYDRIKALKDELDTRVAKLELDVEKEKSRATTVEVSANLAEEMAKKSKESYTRTYGELLETKERLQSAQDDYAELPSHLVSSMTEMYENLKAQVRVLAPELDLTLFSMDNVVEDGMIVPTPNDEDDGPLSAPPAKSAAVSASTTPSAEVVPPEPEPDVEAHVATAVRIQVWVRLAATVHVTLLLLFAFIVAAYYYTKVYLFMHRNTDKEPLLYDHEIERTLQKQRKQARAQEVQEKTFGDESEEEDELNIADNTENLVVNNPNNAPVY
nr:uncharacterized protein LOC112709271 [Arachis hypogaea]